MLFKLLWLLSSSSSENLHSLKYDWMLSNFVLIEEFIWLLSLTLILLNMWSITKRKLIKTSREEILNLTAKYLNLYPVNNTQIELFSSKMFFLFPEKYRQPGRWKRTVPIRMEFWVKAVFLNRRLQDGFLQKMSLILASPLNRLCICKRCCEVLRVFDRCFDRLIGGNASTHFLMYCVNEPYSFPNGSAICCK